MRTKTLAEFEASPTTDGSGEHDDRPDDCDEWAALPGEFPCADCYISREKELLKEGGK